MARTVRDAKLESPTARAKLKMSYVPYWRAIDPGLHLGYRKGSDGGKWVARWYLRNSSPRAKQRDGTVYKHPKGKAYYHETLDGITDDRQGADGVTVLNFAQAQKKVRELYAAAHAPAADAGPLTVRQAVETYIEYLRTEKKTAADTRQRLDRHIIPKIGDRPVARLTTKELEAVRNAMVRKDPADPNVERASKDTANRCFTALRAALNRAFQDETNGIPTDAAWRRVKPFKDVGGVREVFLDLEQSRRLINVTAGAFRNFVTAALLTGARPPHELAGLKVRHLHADLGSLTIVDGKTGPRDVVLTSEAVGFFERVAAGRAPDDLLLPRENGTAWGKGEHINEMRDAVAKAKLPAGCTAYTLRHSHASQALLNGMNLQLLAENMGTSVKMIEQHYGKFAASAKRKLIEESAPKLGLDEGTVAVMKKGRTK
jgi:integrase